MGPQECAEGEHQRLEGQGEAGDQQIAARFGEEFCRDLHPGEDSAAAKVDHPCQNQTDKEVHQGGEGVDLAYFVQIPRPQILAD